ncbi:hypothetical protein [Methylobrevis pamukkalensis]|uniref:Uncharacterized protein n=1 Tax=Methylobrevis pamukkalensis TaxID=1439726 RepID=A0A1E3GZ13_9HYPH|nr:hypothetical protein [Methylobrevis pamukkalensis]ODN68796.1 hypothetical protein A6302_03897 [Methylobrevis pamukkalensis]
MKTYGVSTSRLDSYGRYQPRNRSQLNQAAAKNLWSQQSSLLRNAFYVRVDATAGSLNNLMSQVRQREQVSSLDSVLGSLKPIDMSTLGGTVDETA